MKILVAFDGSVASGAALARAVEFFGPSRPEVVLLAVLTPPMTTSDLGGQAFDSARAELEEALRVAAGGVGEAGLPVRLLLVEGEPREVLERVTAEEAPSVVVVGARGRGRVARVLLGSVSSHAVHHLPVPVLVVR